MKFRSLREEVPTNSAGTGGFGANANAPVAGYDPKLGDVAKRKKIDPRLSTDPNKEQEQKQFEAFRSTGEALKEWYSDNYDIQFIDTDGKTKTMEVRNTLPVGVKSRKTGNKVGYKALSDQQMCSGCGNIKCSCDSKKKQWELKVNESHTLNESGGGGVDQLQDIVATNKAGFVTHNDGTRTPVDVKTAKVLLSSYDKLDASNKTKFINTTNSSSIDFDKLVVFSKQTK